MPDGSFNADSNLSLSNGVSDEREELPRDDDGIHFCRRRRSKVLPLKERLLDIHRYDAVTRQAPKVGTTATANVEEAAIALKRFCLTDLEAKLEARKANRKKGKPPATDMLISEVFVCYMLAKGENNTNVASFRDAAKDATRAWPDDPNVSELVRSEQLAFVECNRKLKARAKFDDESPDEFLKDVLPSGNPLRHYIDSTIEMRLALIFAMIRWCAAEGKQITSLVPGKIRDTEWKPHTASGKRAYTNAEVAAIFNAAGRLQERCRIAGGEQREARRNEVYWRYTVTAFSFGARPDCINALTWAQINREDNIVKLNPPERMQTKKRRPTLPMTPTFRYELDSWLASREVDPIYVITHQGEHLKRHVYFNTLLAQAGVSYGSAMIVRHTVRTQLAKRGVPPRIADRWVGHAEQEGSATGRDFYIHVGLDDELKPYLQQCVDALEAWLDEIQLLVDYPIGNRFPRGKDPRRVKIAYQMTGPVRGSFGALALNQVSFNSLRSNCIATGGSNLLNAKESGVN